MAGNKQLQNATKEELESQLRRIEEKENAEKLERVSGKIEVVHRKIDVERKKIEAAEVAIKGFQDEIKTIRKEAGIKAPRLSDEEARAEVLRVAKIIGGKNKNIFRTAQVIDALIASSPTANEATIRQRVSKHMPALLKAKEVFKAEGKGNYSLVKL